jgi:hypothetical protein
MSSPWRRAVSFLPTPFHRAHHYFFHWKAKRNWVVTEKVERPDPLGDVPLYAVIATWCEEDVIEATVRNALAQGVDRVYLIDNASPDATVERALAAGATLARRYESSHGSIVLRTQFVNEVIYNVSTGEGLPHIWWLVLDADEFPQGPGTMTVREYLRTLDRRFRVVGATFVNHYPAGQPAYLEGFHPIDFQPLCELYWQPSLPRCHARHWKHPLLRFDRDAMFVASDAGAHMSPDNDLVEPLVEPQGGIFVHHFQYREEGRTWRPLARRFGSGGESREKTGTRGAGFNRVRSMDDVYAGRWRRVDNARHVRGGAGVSLAPWAERMPDSEPARWYDRAELDAARARWRGQA